MKKVISILLSLIILIGVFTAIPLTAKAGGGEDQSVKKGDFMCVVFEDDMIMITGYTGSASELAIPSQIDGYRVTSIGSDAFYDCTSLKSITIPDSVTSIGNFAFFGCTSLESITIPDGVTYIGYYAFCGCTSLESITIPDGVTYIGYEAFENCTSLENITVDENNTKYSSLDGNLYNKDKSELIQYATGKTATSFSIPDGVTSIGFEAFYGCTSLERITIPDSVTSIGDLAFYNTAYYNNQDNWDNDVLYIGKHLIEAKEDIRGSYSIKNSTITIANNAFDGCTSLESITITDGVTSIGNYAFIDCTSLKSITIPDSVTSIGYSAFEDCTSLTSITIPNSVTNIYFGTFVDCTSLKDVYYLGSESQWNSIGIDPYDVCLTDATIHFSGHDIESGGIIVTVKNDDFPSDTKLKVVNLETTDEKIVYDISLIQGETVIKPPASVTVKIPVPDTMDGANCKVYHKAPDGTYTDMNAVYKDGYMVFTTDHFSVYVLTAVNLNVIIGDVDGDGKVSIKDATLIQKHLAQIITFDEEQLKIADTNGDGKVVITDATQIQKFLAGFIPSLG